MSSSSSPSPSPRICKGGMCRAFKDMTCKVAAHAGMSLAFIELVATSPSAGLLPLLPPSPRTSSPLLVHRRMAMAAIDHFSHSTSTTPSPSTRSSIHSPTHLFGTEQEQKKKKKKKKMMMMMMKRGRFAMAAFATLLLFFMLCFFFYLNSTSVTAGSACLDSIFRLAALASFLLALVKPSLYARKKNKEKKCLQLKSIAQFPEEEALLKPSLHGGKKNKEKQAKSNAQFPEEEIRGPLQVQKGEATKDEGNNSYHSRKCLKQKLRSSFKNLTVQVPRRVPSTLDGARADSSPSSPTTISRTPKPFNVNRITNQRDYPISRHWQASHESKHSSMQTEPSALAPTPLQVGITIFVALGGLFFNVGIAIMVVIFWWVVLSVSARHPFLRRITFGGTSKA